MGELPGVRSMPGSIERGNNNNQGFTTPSTLPPIERQLVVPKDPIQQFFEKRESEPNPFVLPNEDVFVMREREKQEKTLKRQQNLKTKIWDKHKLETNTIAISQLRMSQTSNLISNTSNRHDHIFQGRRKEKEQMNDFIAKKREMFLVQMSLDNYRGEIDKLGDIAKKKEERLAKAEKMLEEDAVRFDTFLRENDRLTYEVIQKAELETKEKQSKALHLKRQIQEIGRTEGELDKLTEQQQVCEKYRAFLDTHTPPEFFEELEKKKEERRKNGQDSEEMNEEDMYFRDPEQLLSQFTQLEERNLFLFQSVLDNEEGLSELRNRCTQISKESKVEEQNVRVKTQQDKIQQEQGRSQLYGKTADTETSHEHLLEQISTLINDTYKSVGHDAQPEGSLELLTRLEEELENTVKEIHRYAAHNVNIVAEQEREREGLRRANLRAAKTKETERLNRERLAVSLARAQAAVRPKAGRPVMARSVPAKKKTTEVHDVGKNEQEEEEHRMFFCE